MNLKNSKEAILNQALTIFGRLGFHKTTMADIAEASKRGRRTIYTYFKNKEEVYEAVIEREIQRIILELKADLDTVSSVNDKFANYINSRMKAIIELSKNYEALRIAFLNNYKWVERMRKQLDKEEKAILNQLLSLPEASKEFNIVDKDLTIKNIMLMIKGVEYTLIKYDIAKNTDKQIENLQHLMLNGLLVRN